MNELTCSREFPLASWLAGRLASLVPMLACAWAVVPASGSDEFVVRTWQTEDGLPQNSGTAIAQTSDGYLWVGTFNGLVRFNGVGFTRFTIANTKELPTDDINALHEDRTGRLWIGTFAGLAWYDHGRFTPVRNPEQLSGANIRTFAERSDGTVFVATDRGVWCWHDGQFTELVIPGAEWTTYASLVVRCRDGEIWLSHRGTLYRLQGDELKMEWEFEATINALAVSPDGDVWCEQGGEVLKFQPGQTPSDTGIRVGRVTAFRSGSGGDWWIASREKGLHRLRDGQATAITTADGLGSNRLMALIEDREGNVWVGTDGGGFSRLRRKQLTTYSVENGVSHTDVVSIAEDRQGRTWLGTFGGGLCVGENGQWRPFLAPEVLAPDETVMALCQTRDGTLWLGRKTGSLCRLRNERLEVEPRSQVGAARALFEDAEGGLWIGSDQHGVEHYRGEQTRRWNTTNGLSNNFITAFAQEAGGAIWIGTGNGLNRLADGTVKRFFAKDGLGVDPIHSLFVDGRGTLWIGTAGGGLTRYQEGRFATVTSKQGLHSDVVGQILEDDEGNFWIGSTTGIFRVSKESVHEVLDGRSPVVRCSSFGTKDGMRGVDCPGGFQPACRKARDGRLWFCTNGGVTVVDPKTVQRSDLPPPVHVERLVVDGIEVGAEASTPLASGVPPRWAVRAIAPAQLAATEPDRTADSSGNRTGTMAKVSPRDARGSPLRVPAGAKRLEFHCAALDFTAPEQAQFKFWLEGYEETWQEGGSRRVAYYSRVPPGQYRFHVMAANTDGVWNETEAVLALVLQPTWRQSWWYRGAMVLSVFGVLAAFYHRRVSELKRARSQQVEFSRQLIESQEAERKRISSELHDSLGQSLLIIKNRAARVLRGPPLEPAADNELREIGQVTADALEEVRTIARALRPFQLDAFGLTRTLRSLAQQVAEANGLECESDIDGLDAMFSPESEISLYRIVQESLNNVVKHANASRICVTARRTGDTVSISVEDNGCGFDHATAKRPSAGPAGQGLAGMEQRVRLLGGRMDMGRLPGGGTRVAVTMPVRRSEPK